jgi:hypothetical protein
MAAIDSYRRRRGKSAMFPDGGYRDNYRKNWAASRYSRSAWLGFSLGFGAFGALGVVVLLTGGTVVGVVCAVLFIAMMITCLVQAVRAGRATLQ